MLTGMPDILSKLLTFYPVTGVPTSLNMANFGKFEFLRLDNRIPAEGFYSGTIPLDFWLAGDMLFATAGRGELEARAGGPVSQNLKTNCQDRRNAGKWFKRKNQGRTASYPTAPSQIPACGITAPGSSNLLTYALTSVTQRVSAAYLGTFQ
jgi:hypothetical protein